MSAKKTYILNTKTVGWTPNYILLIGNNNQSNGLHCKHNELLKNRCQKNTILIELENKLGYFI